MSFGKEKSSRIRWREFLREKGKLERVIEKVMDKL